MNPNLPTLARAVVAAWVMICWSGSRVAVGQSACADLGGSLDREQVCHGHIAAADYTLDFSVPLSYPDQPLLTDFLRQTRDEWVDDAQLQPPRDRPPYLLAITGTAYHSGPPGSGTRSVVLAMDSDFGAHPVGTYKAFDYDLGKSAPITIDTLFKPGIDPPETLSPIFLRELGTRGAGDSPSTDPGAEAYRNFAITDDAVIFFVNQGQVLPAVDGPQEMSVPRAELAPLLS